MISIHLTAYGVTINGISLSQRGNTLADKITELLMLRDGYVSEDELMDYIYSDDLNPPGQEIIGVVIASSIRPILRAYGIGVDVRYSDGWRITNKPRVFLTKYKA